MIRFTRFGEGFVIGIGSLIFGKISREIVLREVSRRGAPNRIRPGYPIAILSTQAKLKFAPIETAKKISFRDWFIGFEK